jgi:SynChlorMet cassette protein ScmC
MEIESDKCYSLKLADEKSWEIAARAEACPWLDKLASIMQLNANAPAGKPKLIFVRDFFQTQPDNSAISVSRMNHSRNGWKIDHIGDINLLSRPGETIKICDLRNEGVPSLEFNKMWLALYPLYIHALDSGGLPLHATFVELNGRGFAIAAPGGTGKSTCSRRIPPPWKALSDDEMLVVRDESGTYHSHPLPTWKEHIYFGSNRAWNVQYHIPLAGIFFLLRSEEDYAESIGNGKAATLIYRSASQVFHKTWIKMNPANSNAIRAKIFQNACQIAEKIPAYFLKASLTGNFWEKMEEALEGDGVALEKRI